MKIMRALKYLCRFLFAADRLKNTINLLIAFNLITSYVELLKQFELTYTHYFFFEWTQTVAYCYSNVIMITYSINSITSNGFCTFYHFQNMLVSMCSRAQFASGFLIAVVRYFWIVKEDRSKDFTVTLPLGAFFVIFLTLIKMLSFSKTPYYFLCREAIRNILT